MNRPILRRGVLLSILSSDVAVAVSVSLGSALRKGQISVVPAVVHTFAVWLWLLPQQGHHGQMCTSLTRYSL